ncbi:MAG: amidohydrolase family protein [Planctomycetes bacterium]|nr:amidohydrolase family protein [Planctomycetota bacterium]
MFAFTLTFTLASILFSGTSEPEDGTFLIHNVQIWNSDGPPTGPHSVLLQNGLLAAIGGPDRAINDFPEATIIHAEDDWVLYPGLIHAQFQVSTEQPDTPYADEVTDPTLGPLVAMENGTRASLRGWAKVADHLEWDPSSGDAWRTLGFTSAIALPKRGIIRGASAWISLNGKALGEALLLRDGPGVFGLRGFGSYPRTPMGALAVLRQAFLDAERAERFRRYENPDLDALKNGIFVANNKREIENILDLLREYSPGQGGILLGGRGAQHFTERLREQKVSVLYVLDLEEAPANEEDAKVAALGERPYWQTPQKKREEERRLHQEHVREFQTLLNAGVSCALVPPQQSGELKKSLEQMRTLGLADEDLYRALGPDVAQVLGLDQSWRQKGADFMLSRGAIDMVEPDLAWIFADGRGWHNEAKDQDVEETKPTEPEEPRHERRGRRGPRTDAAPTALAGRWVMKTETPFGLQEFGIHIRPQTKQAEIFELDDLTDTLDCTGVTFTGNRVSFQFAPPDRGFPVTATVQVDGGQATGSMGAFGRSMPAELSRFQAGAGGTKQSTPEDAPEVRVGHPEWPTEIAADRIPTNDYQGNVLLKGGTLWSVTGSPPFVGDLLIQDGIITQMGVHVAPPEGTPLHDAQGLHIIPGIIDTHSHLALASINEGSVSISAEVAIGDMINTEEVGIFRAAAGGTTVVQSLHGSANPIGGRSAVWFMDFREPTIAGVRLDVMPGIKFALGENVKQSNSGGRASGRFPNSRMGVQAVYRRAFTAAQGYIEQRARFEAGELDAFRRDVRLEVLADILLGNTHIHCHSYRGDELEMFLNICKEFGIERPTFQHVLEGYKVAPEIAAQGAMASTFADWWAYKFEVYDAIPWNPALMYESGVITTINSDSDDLIRRLNTEAGKSRRYGMLSDEASLELCTMNAAIQLRLEDRMGSLEVGKDGTVSVFDGHPLSTWSRNMLTLAMGRTLFERAELQDQDWETYYSEVAAFASAAPADERLDFEEIEPVQPVAEKEEWQPWIQAGKGKSYLIENAVLHPISSEPLFGSLLVQDGRIVEIGAKLQSSIPKDCIRVNAAGRQLFPTFINGLEAVGLMEIESVLSSRDDREAGTDQPDLSAASAVHSDSRHIRVVRMAGIGHVLTSPTSGRMRGQAALIQLSGDTNEEMVVVPDLALHIEFPRSRAAQKGKGPKVSSSVKTLTDWFERAEAYAERQEKLTKSEGSIGVAPARDLQLEALLPYLRGEKPVILQTHDAATLMAARAWAKELELDVIYAGAQDAWKIAGYLGADQAKVIVGEIHDLPRADTDPYDSSFRNAAVLRAAGCTVGLRTNDTQVARNLPFSAATAGSHGLGRNGALHALTLGAAEVLGVDSFTGSLEVGKAGNFFLSDGDPLDNSGQVQRMWLGGAEVELTSAQTELRDRYRARNQAKQSR